MPLADGEWANVKAALRLTQQQAKIVELILRGQRDKQIARSLRLSVPTVRTHLTRVFQRCGLGDRVDLVVAVFVAARAKPTPDSVPAVIISDDNSIND